MQLSWTPLERPRFSADVEHVTTYLSSKDLMEAHISVYGRVSRDGLTSRPGLRTAVTCTARPA